MIFQINQVKRSLYSEVYGAELIFFSNIETHHLQHLKIIFATSKNLDLILKHLRGTVTTCKEHKRNIFTTIAT
jgi:hypothetical protein